MVDRLDIRRMEDVGLPEQVDAVVLVGAMGLVTAAAGFALMTHVERRLVGDGAAWWYSRIAVGAAVMIGLAATVSVLAVVLVAFVMQSALRNALHPITTGWANRHATSEVRATVLSFVGQAEASGEILGGLLLGAVAASAGLPTALGIAAALHVVAAVLASRERRASAPVTAPRGGSA